MPEITSDHLESAKRGLEMQRKTPEQLAQLIERHEQIEMFASQVIVAAAREVLNHE
jgi:hypothetical protein